MIVCVIRALSHDIGISNNKNESKDSQCTGCDVIGGSEGGRMIERS